MGKRNPILIKLLDETKKDIDHFLNKYAEKVISGDASLFLGSGVSRDSGFPSWAALLAPCAEELGIDMGDDTEIADLALVAHMQKPPSKSPHGSLDPAACIRIRPDAQPVWRENTGLPDMSKRPMRCFVRLILSFSAPARKR